MPSGGDPLWAFVYPETYDVGMANLGVHSVYRALRERGVAAERFFKGPFQGISVESDRPISDFRLLTASIVYEPDILTFLSMLGKWGVPATWSDRLQKDGPIIGAGGGISYINPLGLSHYVDFIALGDGEGLFDHLVDTVRSYFSGHRDRRRFWETLAESPFFFVPPVHLEPLLNGRGISRQKSICSDMKAAYGKSTWITPRSVFPDTFLVETQRGCWRNCRFCTIPACFGPPRIRPADLVIADIMTARAEGAERVGVIAPESGDYPWIGEVLQAIRNASMAVSFASLRVDSLTEEMLETLSESGQRTLTIAPETGDDAFRKSCGKDFPRDVIIEKLQMAREKGVAKVKMYFMIGLPQETEEHILETARLIEQVRKETALKTIASLSVFVPKPQTPWQNEKLASAEHIRTRLGMIRRFLSKTGVRGVELRIPSYREAAREYNLAWSSADSEISLAAAKTGNHRDAARVLKQLELLGFSRELRE